MAHFSFSGVFAATFFSFIIPGLSNISGKKTNMDQGKEMAKLLDGPSEKGGPLRFTGAAVVPG